MDNEIPSINILTEEDIKLMYLKNKKLLEKKLQNRKRREDDYFDCGIPMLEEDGS